MNFPELINCLFCLQNHWNLQYMMGLEDEDDGQQSVKFQRRDSC